MCLRPVTLVIIIVTHVPLLRPIGSLLPRSAPMRLHCLPPPGVVRHQRLRGTEELTPRRDDGEGRPSLALVEGGDVVGAQLRHAEVVLVVTRERVALLGHRLEVG